MTTEAFPKVRGVDLADVQAVADICNEAILSPTAKFDIEPIGGRTHAMAAIARRKASNPRGRGGWQGFRPGVPYPFGRKARSLGRGYKPVKGGGFCC